MTTKVILKPNTRKKLLRFSARRRAKKMDVVSLSTTMARQGLSECINRVRYGGQLVRLERHGKPVAGLVPPDLLELLRDIEDRIDLREALAALKEGGSKPWAKLKEELGL